MSELEIKCVNPECLGNGFLRDGPWGSGIRCPECQKKIESIVAEVKADLKEKFGIEVAQKVPPHDQVIDCALDKLGVKREELTPEQRELMVGKPLPAPEPFDFEAEIKRAKQADAETAQKIVDAMNEEASPEWKPLLRPTTEQVNEILPEPFRKELLNFVAEEQVENDKRRAKRYSELAAEASKCQALLEARNKRRYELALDAAVRGYGSIYHIYPEIPADVIAKEMVRRQSLRYRLMVVIKAIYYMLILPFVFGPVASLFGWLKAKAQKFGAWLKTSFSLFRFRVKTEYDEVVEKVKTEVQGEL